MPLEHLNFVGGMAGEPIVISVQFSKQLDSCKVLLRTRKVGIPIQSIIPLTLSTNQPIADRWSLIDRLTSNLPALLLWPKFDRQAEIPRLSSKSKLVSQLHPLLPALNHVKLKEVKDSAIREDLAHMEDRLLVKFYKFGIIYYKEGQTNEDDMFSNGEWASMSDTMAMMVMVMVMMTKMMNQIRFLLTSLAIVDRLLIDSQSVAIYRAR